VHDWTSKGSLRSTVLDDALFSPALPEGKLSQIIEDEEGFHIVRVLNREAAKRVPFSDVQVEIKKRMHDGLQERKRNEYVAKLRDHTPISTVFDAEDKAVAREPHAAAFR